MPIPIMQRKGSRQESKWAFVLLLKLSWKEAPSLLTAAGGASGWQALGQGLQFTYTQFN